MTNTFERHTLSNGTVLLTENLPYMRTVSIGLWVRYGSRFDPAGQRGAAHFIEHMLFKGIPGMSPRDIAIQFEQVGGSFNASASKETTHIYAKMLSGHLPLAIDMLMGMALDSDFPAHEFDREKEVVLEEIRGRNDSPEEIAYDQFITDIYGDSGLGYSILGDEATIEPITRDGLFDLYRSVYTSEAVQVSITGNFGQFDVPALVEKAIATHSHTHSGKTHLIDDSRPVFTGKVNLVNHKAHQAQLFLGFPGVPYASPRRYEYAALDMILSGGMSSRLFQEVRELRGLVYDISTENSSYSDSGYFAAYASVRPSNMIEVLSITVDELIKVRGGAVTADELDRVKEQLCANMIMSLESVTSRMTKLARCEFYFGRNLSDSEILDGIRKVTLDDIVEISRETFRGDRAVLSALGPFGRGGEKQEDITARMLDVIARM